MLIMEKSKKIKFYIGLFYLIFIALFLYYFFSNLSRPPNVTRGKMVGSLRCLKETTNEKGSQKKTSVWNQQHSAKKFQRPNQLKYSAFSEKNVALQALSPINISQPTRPKPISYSRLFLKKKKKRQITQRLT